MSKEGWLSKEGGAIKSWKKRWFVLEGDELVYYSKQGGEKKGSISLKEVSEAKPEEYKDKKNCFKIVTTGRTYYLSAPTPEDLKKWVDLIKEDIKKKKNKGNDNNAPKQVGIDDFETLKMIGSGGFGKVLQVRYKPTGQVMAMKVLNKKAIVEADEVEKTMTEKNILIKLDSPFLVNLHFAFQTPGKIIFVMDYINGGELFYHLQQQERGFDTDRVRFYAAEILLGIEYLHAKGVVYRDLKPENILINKDGHICMTDFGISKEGLVSKDDRTATFCGTPEYLAPEVLQGKKYGKEVDWWSFGTLIFEMLTGMPPFYSDDVQQMYRKILNEPVDRDAIAKYDPSAVDIILGLLERDVSKRLSNPDIIKKHPYFRPINWDKLSKREIKPPFVPQVRGEECTGNIDPTFTRQKAALTITSPDVLSQTAQDKFLNFTYIAKSELND